MKPIHELTVRERPREKLEASGPEALLDEELLAILLGSGIRGVGVHEVARELLRVIDRQNDGVTFDDLQGITGMGPAKATKVLAAFEFARRRIRPRGVRIQEAKDVLPLVAHWANREKEHFITISLNGAHEVIATRVVTVGLVNSSQIHPREVFADAIADRACAVVAAHNHPSGNVAPSEADRKVTRVLLEAGKLLGITFLDHIIFSSEGFYSFQESDTLH